MLRTYEKAFRSNSLENGSQNSSGGSSGDIALKKIKGPKVVKSRYMQYDKPKITKKNNVANTTVLSAGKSQEKSGSGTPTRKSMAPQRFKAPLVPSNVPDGSFLCKDDLQSTLLDGHKIARPDLDLSVINDKTLQKLTPRAQQTSEQRKPKREASASSSISEDLIDMIESQTLIFTYLTMKMQKNITRLEEKAERSLLLVHDEKTQLQEKVQQLKRELLMTKREGKLNDLLDKQAETLAPSTATTIQFKDNYSSFATALDFTRHQLPIKDIHIPGTRQRFLEDTQKHLASTKALLQEALPSPASDSMDLLDTTKNLEDVVLKTDAELSRSLHQVLDLSFKVNKEVSLQNQKLVEKNSEMDLVRQWYFD
ncbi:HAUS augmin-like complex subunit 8 isoform X2 [Hyla sarda]|uniref:HAUS augmin-like complex subunit 8 isoform X2 n=1 Tax=Hyla sarda TaxID=327740 RepID=UPI0024C3C76E|nr:HAUS augmin-like complex subunit 8 isoform X2 [Hyla sarda]